MQGNGLSGADGGGSSVSGDGRYVAFVSSANNLVAGDTNNRTDVFVFDRVTDTIERIQGASQPNDDSDYTPTLSVDGRYVAFVSEASNLGFTDSNGVADVFVKDRTTGTIEWITSGANGASGEAVITPDGRYVVFTSLASNLVAGDSNGVRDVFRYDLLTDTMERVSVSSSEAQGNGAAHDIGLSISNDGRYVAFSSAASNLVSGDTNGENDVFIRDLTLGTTQRVSVATGGAQATGGDSFGTAMSADGRYVAYMSEATNLVAGDTNAATDVFLFDRQTNTTTLISKSVGGTIGNDNSFFPTLSDDARYIAFATRATNLVPGTDANGSEQDVLVWDLVDNTLQRVNVNASGQQSSGGGATLGSFDPWFSADGRVLSIESTSVDLVTGDTNGVRDIFVIPGGDWWLV